MPNTSGPIVGGGTMAPLALPFPPVLFLLLLHHHKHHELHRDSISESSMFECQGSIGRRVGMTAKSRICIQMTCCLWQYGLSSFQEWDTKFDGFSAKKSIYRKVTSSRLSRLVAHIRIFSLFMEWKFDAYVVMQQTRLLLTTTLWCSKEINIFCANWPDIGHNKVLYKLKQQKIEIAKNIDIS